MSEISAQDAIGAYVAAAAHVYGVEASQVIQPSFFSVEEFEDGAFRVPVMQINSQNEQVAAVVECAYLPFMDMWAVLFNRDDEPIFFTKEGEQFAVFNMDKREAIIARMMGNAEQACPNCGATNKWSWSHARQEYLCYNCDPRAEEITWLMKLVEDVKNDIDNGIDNKVDDDSPF